MAFKNLKSVSRVLNYLCHAYRIFIYIGIIVFLIIATAFPSFIENEVLNGASVNIKIDFSAFSDSPGIQEQFNQIMQKMAQSPGFTANEKDNTLGVVIDNKSIIPFIKRLSAVIYVEIVYLVIISFILLYASRVFKELSDKAIPFSESISKNIKMIAWLTLSSGLPMLINKSLSLIDSSNGFHLNLDITYIILTLVFFALAYVFEYGCKLQQLSDETL